LQSFKLRRPAYDRKLKLVESQVADLDAALRYVKRFDCVVQAGGAYGLWPLALADRFNTVYTFEPDGHNFPLLAENTAERVNVIRWQAALGIQWARSDQKVAARRDRQVEIYGDVELDDK